MKYGVFSDVHSNLEALEAVLAFFKKKDKVDMFIFLGDAVGYGANPNEVIILLKELTSLCIAGNHDWAAVGKFDVEYFNPIASEAICWTQRKLEKEAVLYLHSLPLIYDTEDFVCVHGSLFEPDNFHYIMNRGDAEISFSLLRKKICFVGHTHRREIYILKNGRIYLSFDSQVSIEKNAKYIINVGSVGQPRDRDWRASVCVYDDEKNEVYCRRVEYNIKKTGEKILDAGLPPALAHRLYMGC